MKPSWLKSKSVKKARRALRKSWKKLKERGLHIDKVNYDTVKSEYREELCKAKAKYEDELVDALPTTPKSFITIPDHSYRAPQLLTHF